MKKQLIRTTAVVASCAALVMSHASERRATALTPVPADYNGALLPNSAKGLTKYWLIAGNSNICGRLYKDPNQPDEDYTHAPQILRYGPGSFTGGQGWRGYDPAKDVKGSGMCFNDLSAIGTLGPQDLFAREMVRRGPSHYFAGVAFCASGTSYEAWTKRTDDPNLDKTNPAANMFWRLFVRSTAFVGAVPFTGCGTDSRWCRETDQFARFGDWAGLIVLADGDATVQGRQLVTDLVAGYRKTMNRPNLPVVLTAIPPWKGGSQEVRKALLEVAQYVSNARCIQTSDLSTSDGSHFDRNSCVKMGVRYADAFADIAGYPTVLREGFVRPAYGLYGSADTRLVLNHEGGMFARGGTLGAPSQAYTLLGTPVRALSNRSSAGIYFQKRR